MNAQDLSNAFLSRFISDYKFRIATTFGLMTFFSLCLAASMKIGEGIEHNELIRLGLYMPGDQMLLTQDLRYGLPIEHSIVTGSEEYFFNQIRDISDNGDWILSTASERLAEPYVILRNISTSAQVNGLVVEYKSRILNEDTVRLSTVNGQEYLFLINDLGEVQKINISSIDLYNPEFNVEFLGNVVFEEPERVSFSAPSGNGNFIIIKQLGKVSGINIETKTAEVFDGEAGNSNNSIYSLLPGKLTIITRENKLINQSPSGDSTEVVLDFNTLAYGNIYQAGTFNEEILLKSLDVKINLLVNVNTGEIRQIPTEGIVTEIVQNKIFVLNGETIQVFEDKDTGIELSVETKILSPNEGRLGFEYFEFK